MPATTIEGCVVSANGTMRGVTGQWCGRLSIAGTRKVLFLASKKRKLATEFGPVLPFKKFHIDKKEPTLDDIAAYLRPGKKLKVGDGIFGTLRRHFQATASSVTSPAPSKSTA